MGVFRRVGEIISANLNDLVEKCEDPEKLLRQAVREMEAWVEGSMEGAARAIASERLLSKELAGHRQQAEEWQAKAERAVRADKLEAARGALKRKSEHEKLARTLEVELESLQVTSRTVQEQVGALRAKLAEARRRLASLAARKRVAEARKKLHSGGRGLPTETFARFDRLRERIEESEAEADALGELYSGPGAAPPPPEDSADSSIEEELAALRAKLGK